MHHQRTNANSSTNAATSTHGHARAHRDRHNRADQHTDANADSDSYGNGYRNSISHTDRITIPYRDIDSAANRNSQAYAVTDPHRDTYPASATSTSEPQRTTLYSARVLHGNRR